MKGLSILVSLLIAGIAAAWYVPTMIWGYQITKESQSVDQDNGERLAELAIGPAPVRWFRNRKEMRGHYSLEDLTSYRSVAYSIEMPFEALLAPGESAPEEAYRELYAMARAPSRLIAMCPEILGALASKCDVGQSEGDIRRDGTVRVSGHLDYIPAYDIGDPSAVKNGEVVTSSARIVDHRELANTPENRAEAFRRSLSLCDTVREKFGNCVLASLRFSPDVYDGVETVSAMATFAVNADKTVYRRDSVQAELDRMAEVLLN